MSSPQPPDTGVDRFVLKVQPPLRALAVAAGTEVLGAVLLVLWGALRWPVVLAVLGGLLLAFGSALLLAAVLAQVRLGQTVELSESGVTLQRGSRRHELAWSDVSQVTLRGSSLRLGSTPDAPSLEVVNPGGTAEPTFTALMATLQQRLDAHRGYHPLE